MGKKPEAEMGRGMWGLRAGWGEQDGMGQGRCEKHQHHHKNNMELRGTQCGVRATEDPGVMTGSRGGVAQLGSAHRDRVGREDQTPCVDWAAGRTAGTGSRCISPPTGVPATPHQFPRQDRQHCPPAAAQEGSTEGTGEGFQGLYSSHGKQAWCGGDRMGPIVGAEGALHVTLA